MPCLEYHIQATLDAIAVGINPVIFVNQINAESGFNDKAKSPAGAIGIAQFMPATAKGLKLDPTDGCASLAAAAGYNKQKLDAYNGDYQKMLASYNAGSGTVDSAVRSRGSNWLLAMPAETQNYVATILKGVNLSGIQICAPGDCNCIYGAGTSQATQCLKQLKASPNSPSVGVDTQAITDPIQAAIQAAFQPFFDKLPGFGVKAGLFMGALMVVIIGMWVLTRNPAADTNSAVTQSLNNSARRIGSSAARRKSPPANGGAGRSGQAIKGVQPKGGAA